MDILRLYNDEPFIVDVNEFFMRNSFLFFNPHEKKSVEQSFAEMVKDSYYGVYHDGIMIAYGMLRGMDEGYEIPMLGIAVDGSYENKGVGTLLMKFLETDAKLNGYTKMRLRVHKNNFKAVGFYIRLNYFAFDYSGDCFWMEKDL